ncbi:MAG: RHS repeat-associated core domain-containing protein [Hoylesella marshii]|uniref:RHS repeat-associated core domain-containing protein n=1 Tax=Hoylesella marshii TaxID=189722 RepID=UPI003FA02B66
MVFGVVSQWYGCQDYGLCRGIQKITENGRTREFYYLDGNKVFDASYDAWGRQTVTRNDIGLHRGYTGHEMLGEFDIMNMNRRSPLRSRESTDRLYDPVLGRFFSPDNYVQLPDYSQSFNRYSYCLNNPLKYTDADEQWFGIDDLLVVGAGFVTGYLANAASSEN